LVEALKKVVVAPGGSPYTLGHHMKTKSDGKNRGTFALLETVAPNLFRHRENQSYWGVRKIEGRRFVHALETADRKTADGKLAEWLGDLKKVDPGNRDMTLAMLLEKYEAARTDIADSTRVGEKGRIAKFRELFPRPMETLVARVLTRQPPPAPPDLPDAAAPWETVPPTGCRAPTAQTPEFVDWQRTSAPSSLRSLPVAPLRPAQIIARSSGPPLPTKTHANLA